MREKKNYLEVKRNLDSKVNLNLFRLQPEKQLRGVMFCDTDHGQLNFMVPLSYFGHIMLVCVLFQINITKTITMQGRKYFFFFFNYLSKKYSFLFTTKKINFWAK